MIDNEALARRAVACPAWEWWRGPMRVDRRVGEWTLHGVKHGHDGDLLRVWYEGRTEWWRKSECLPDLADPATLGCMLALVREAWGEPKACLFSGLGGWVVLGDRTPPDAWYPTEAAALVAALEAAPAREVKS